MSTDRPEKTNQTTGDQADITKAILEKRPELIKYTYSTLDSKHQITEDFNAKYPDCSKKSIERVFKQLFVKEKRGNDQRPVYYTTPEILAEHELAALVDMEELDKLAALRMAPLIEEFEKEERKRQLEREEKEEKKRQELAEKEEKLREIQQEKEKARQLKEKERLEREQLKEKERLEKEKEREIKA